MSAVQISLPPKLIDVFSGEADVRGAWGGRGSGKTRSFAKMSAVRGYMWDQQGRCGQIVCGRQFMNSLADSSLEEVRNAILEEPWLASHYDMGEKYIRTKSGNVYYSFVGLDRNIDSIKSKARILLGWVDEAEPVIEEAWTKLIPTLREEDSELWVTWNPERKASATHKRFRETQDPRYKIVELNWRDNPKFPSILERQRQRDMKNMPDQYGWIWEGNFRSIVEGAYYAKSLTQAKAEGRIGKVAANPLMTLRAFVDIGGTGSRSDAFSIWISQFIGKEIRILDYYEAVGQDGGTHFAWLRGKGYTPDRCQIWLPHDGVNGDKVYATSYEKFFRDAGYKVTVIKNQGRGAAMARVEAARRLFPAMWFNEETTEGGRDALGWYHEKKDEERGIGLGVNHDWSSHACFPAGTMIETDRGPTPIELVNVGDFVLTPDGYAPVYNSGVVKRANEMVRLKFSDDTVLECTPDHNIFTTGGLFAAGALRYNSSVLKEGYKACLSQANVFKMGYRDAFTESLKGLNTGFGIQGGCTAHSAVESNRFSIVYSSSLMMVGRLRAAMMSFLETVTGKTSPPQTGACSHAAPTGQSQQNTYPSHMMGRHTIPDRMDTTKGVVGESTYTGQYISKSEGQFQTDITSTTSTETRQTTVLKTLNACQPQNIPHCMQRTVSGSVAPEMCSSYIMQENLHQYGTALKKVLRGIKSMAKGAGKNASRCLQFVLNALPSTVRFTRTNQNSVVNLVSKERYTVESVPVYDLSVRHHHCYYANGILVSNCDAFGLMAIAYEEPISRSKTEVFKPRKVL